MAESKRGEERRSQVVNGWSAAEHMLVLTQKAQGRQNVECSCGWSCKRMRAQATAQRIREHKTANLTVMARAREIARNWWSGYTVRVWVPNREPAEYTLPLLSRADRGYDE